MYTVCFAKQCQFFRFVSRISENGDFPVRKRRYLFIVFSHIIFSGQYIDQGAFTGFRSIAGPYIHGIVFRTQGCGCVHGIIGGFFCNSSSILINYFFQFLFQPFMVCIYGIIIRYAYFCGISGCQLIICAGVQADGGGYHDKYHGG